jgi:hypothetical protein
MRPAASLRPGRPASSQARRVTRDIAHPPRRRTARTTALTKFDNLVCFLELDGRRARLWLQKTVQSENDGVSLETLFARQLAQPIFSVTSCSQGKVSAPSGPSVTTTALARAGPASHFDVCWT